MKEHSILSTSTRVWRHGVFYWLRAAWRFGERRLKRLHPSYHAIGEKNFSGTLWDRLRGLEFLYDHCRGSTVLDIASCEGLISFELARHGARLAHGFERDNDRVLFSRRLFRDVPIESQFTKTNLAVTSTDFVKAHSDVLLPTYDIVLFLGIFQHLEKQMSESALLGLVEELLNRTARYFVVRTGRYPVFEPLILSLGFRLVHSLPKEAQVSGPVRIYERSSGS